MKGLAGFRRGLVAVPLYFIALGVGLFALATHWSDVATDLPRDGQAFSGTFVVGVLFVLVGLITTPVALSLERNTAALVRGALAAIAVGAAVVAYTATLGFELGGTSGEIQCIVEAGRQICPRGDGTYIRDGRLDLTIMVLAVLVAYALSHAAARLNLGATHGPVAAGLAVIVLTIVGVVAGLIVAYIPSAIIGVLVGGATHGTIGRSGGWVEAGAIGGIAWLAGTGGIVGAVQRLAPPRP